jgi:hypothetical protein
MATIEIFSNKTSGGGGGSGTVTSVGVSSTTLTITGSPVTTAGTIVANIPDGYLKVGTGGITPTLQAVVDTNGTATTLLLSTILAQFLSTLKITTNDEIYLDVEDGTTNNRFTISRPASGQKVALDFASNPTGSTTIVGSIRTYVDGVNLSDVMTFIEDGSIGVGTNTPLGLFHFYKANATTRVVMDGDAGQSKIITFRTGGLQRWGLYSNNVAESGSNAGSNFVLRRYSDAGTLLSTSFQVNRQTGLTTIYDGLDLNGSELKNFSADVETLSSSLQFDSSNTATYNGRVIQMSNACAFTIDNSLPIGFSATFIQTDANTSTFAGVGSVIINNRQGHSSNNGQYSVVSIVKINTLQFILGGDTA